MTKNKFKITGDKTLTLDLKTYVRQKPNKRFLGMAYGLFIYNAIDSNKINLKRQTRIAKLRLKNIHLYEEQAKINNKRNNKALKNGRSDYKFKKVIPFDTINIRLSFREWLKFRFGEKPVVFDSLDFNKTLEQFSIYLKKKGYYESTVSGEINYHKRKAKVIAKYIISTGQVYLIDTLYVNSTSEVLSNLYKEFNEIEKEKIVKGTIFDTDKLNSYREKLSKYMRDHGVYGMNSSNIQFVADSNKQSKTVKLKLEFSARLFKNRTNDKLEPVNHTLTKIKNVYFHIIDTASVPYNFKRKVEILEKNLINNGFVTTIDTVIFTNNIGLNSEKYKRNLSEISDSLKKTRTITLTFNYSYWLRPYVLEDANLLQSNTYYSEDNFDKTLSNLSDLNVFQSIKPEVVDLGNELEIHYYLIPKKKLIYNLKPIVKTSGVYFGFSGNANFTNLNLFKGAEKIAIGFTGGFQSMPNLNKDVAGKEFFNTFEVGPSIKFEIPGLFPISKSRLSKYQKSKTLLQSSYGYQIRNVFILQTFRLNYLYNFSLGKSTEIQFGFPGFSSINYVYYPEDSKDKSFFASIYAKNDPFTQNYYRSQLNWQDLKFIYQYHTYQQKTALNYSFFKSSIDLVGNLISFFSIPSKDLNNKQRTLLGIPYSQFFKMDNEYVLAHKINKETSLHTRVLAGVGIPYKNSQFSVPFDYSFFGGGPNDMRAWRAGSLGPGAYNYYKDTNYSTMQLGDIRLGFSSEFRFKISKTLKAALFVDAGNIWTSNTDIKRPGAKFTNNWYKEIAIGSGFGFRADFDFIVVRVDCGFKLRNPAMAEGYRWFFNKKDEEVYKLINSKNSTYASPFLPRNLNDLFNSFRLGIGYPF